MWIRIRALIVEDEPLAAQYLATLLDDACQVEVVGTATEAAAALALCAERRPDAVFLDIRLPGQDGLSLATQLDLLPQAPRLVFTTGHAERAPSRRGTRPRRCRRAAVLKGPGPVRGPKRTDAGGRRRPVEPRLCNRLNGGGHLKIRRP
ncbi:MAG: response regulator [Verrucomicrobia bacterium]|nr:response regulator [Verrucomicrobiota bacterium]